MTPHLFDLDPDVPPDHLGRRYGRCGMREDHPAHQLPDVPPEQVEHDRRYEREEQ